MEYQRDYQELYWDVIGLIIAHYEGEGAFRRAVTDVAEKIGRTDPYRWKWIMHAVETGSVPSREWEDELLDAGNYGACDGGMGADDSGDEESAE